MRKSLEKLEIGILIPRREPDIERKRKREERGTFERERSSDTGAESPPTCRSPKQRDLDAVATVKRQERVHTRERVGVIGCEGLSKIAERGNWEIIGSKSNC